MALAPTETDVRLRVRGIVQGVGFRPFVSRTASQLGLSGWVKNDPEGVLIRAVGPDENVRALIEALRNDAPSAADVQSVVCETLLDAEEPAPGGFSIVASESADDVVAAAVPPDLALCADCRRELLDPGDRRYHYPFINCTQCGPRYSIIERLPYDRPRTTMRRFRLCTECGREYGDPTDRRFHAEPNACPVCGPRVMFCRSGAVIDAAVVGENAIHAAAKLLREGGIVAVKGVGGYHLLTNACDEAAVAELRRRKHRDEKPLAVMFSDVTAVRACADVSATAETLLCSPAAPIVLVPRRTDSRLAPSVAPGNPWIGALLAYAPLHVLLLRTLDFPVIATSANLAEEPLCTDNDDVHRRLAGIADAFLEHDRPIQHPVDDSVIRLSAEAPILLRRARGYAPVPLSLPDQLTGNWLCVGAQMKSTIGVAFRNQLVLSPHIGDLASGPTLEAYRDTIATLAALHGSNFTAVARDKHPDYASTHHAAELRLPTVAVQHHLAHVLACLLEHGQPPHDVLGVAWDGTGYGEDGTIWGGEFLLLTHGIAHRFGRLRPFRLPGGDAAVRDPRRSALALLHEADDPRFDTFARKSGIRDRDASVLRTMLARRLNAPVTSSAGRLFDAVGALLGLGRQNQFEGQTPLAVEAAAITARSAHSLPIPVRDVRSGRGAACEVDWQPTIEALLEARARQVAPAELAAGFHAALADAIVAVARRAGVGTVALTGGCFQNALLLDRTASALRAVGFNVLVHRVLPPNDGNIAAGQAVAALWGLSSVQMP